MVLNDNLNKFNWVFTNAFRDYLDGKYEVKATTSYSRLLYKHKLDDNRTSIYAYTADDVTDDVPRKLELVGVHYKEQNAFVFEPDTDIGNFPSEFLVIREEMKKPTGRRRKQLTTQEVRQMIMDVNSFRMIEKHFTLSVGNMYILLLANVLRDWIPEERSQAHEVTLNRMFEDGMVPVDDGRILCEFVQKKLSKFVSSRVSNGVLHDLMRDYPNLVQEYIHLSKNTADYIRAVCNAKNMNYMLKVYSEKREPDKSVRVLRALRTAERCGYKKALVQFDYGYKRTEANVNTDICRDDRVQKTYDKEEAFKKDNYQIMSMQSLSAKFESYMPFVKKISVGSRIFFSEDVEINQSEMVLNRVCSCILKESIDETLELLQKEKPDINAKTRYDKYFLVSLSDKYGICRDADKVFEFIRDSYELTEEVKTALQELAHNSYGDRKRRVQLLGITEPEEQSDASDDCNNNNYEDYEDYEDDEEYYEEDDEYGEEE